MRDQTCNVTNNEGDPASLRQPGQYGKQDPARRLEKAKPRLFSQKTTKIQLQTVTVCEDKPNTGNITTDVVLRDQDFEDCFQKHIKLRGNTFIYLFQDHSWAPLNISVRAASRILASIKAPEELFRLLNGFGHPDEGFGTDFPGGYGSYLTAKEEGHESHDGMITSHVVFAYALCYVAKTGRTSSPWSERRMGVYHDFEPSTSLWVILQPTTAALNLPFSDWSVFQRPRDRLSLHLSLFSSCLPPWVAYLQHLDGLIKTKSRKARQPAQKVQTEFAFSTVQDLQYYFELLQNATTQLESNKETLVGLQSISAACRGSYDSEMKHQVLACISQLNINLTWANGMLERIRQISNLMTMLFHIKHSETVSVNTTKLTQLAELSQKDQDTMLDIAKEAKKDSELMKVIAIASLISLPSILITGIFSTGFVTSVLSEGVAGHQSRVTSQALVYTFTTLCLTILVSSALYLWHQRNQSKRYNPKP